MASHPTDFDVLIVGVGISGIGMAAHMRMRCLDRSFCFLWRRNGVASRG